MFPYYETRSNEIFAFTSNNPDSPPHLHIHLELFYVLSGKIQVTIDQQTQILTKGDLGVAFPNCVHGRAIVQPNAAVNVAIVAVKPALAGDFNNIIMNFLPEHPFLSSDSISGEVTNALHRLLDFNIESNRNEYTSILIKSYTQIILGLVIPELTLYKNTRPEYYLIQKSVNYILQNFYEPLTLESVANYAGVTKSHLSAAFAHKMHIGFNQYLNNIRLNCAQDLMRNTDKSITQIAYDCGFGTLRTFNRVFEKNIKMTPSQFRNLQKNSVEEPTV